MNKSKMLMDLQDISAWRNSWYDADLQGIEIAHSNEQISLDERVRLLARAEWVNPTLLVQLENSAKVFIVVVGENPYAINILREDDEYLIQDGELCLKNISWIPEMKIVVFYKYYIVRGKYQKVVIGYESKSEYWIKEETVRNEENVIETSCRFSFDDW